MAENQLAGTISRLNEGAVSCNVALELAGGSLVSATGTSAAAGDLGLKVKNAGLGNYQGVEHHPRRGLKQVASSSITTSSPTAKG